MLINLSIFAIFNVFASFIEVHGRPVGGKIVPDENILLFFVDIGILALAVSL